MKKREMTIFGRFKSIRDAMMLSFSVLVVVAVLIFLLIAMNFTKKTIYENSRTSTSQLISQVNYDIDSYIDYMENISWVAASGRVIYLIRSRCLRKRRLRKRGS